MRTANSAATRRRATGSRLFSKGAFRARCCLSRARPGVLLAVLVLACLRACLFACLCAPLTRAGRGCAMLQGWDLTRFDFDDECLALEWKPPAP